ncbi:MAG: Transporter, LysE family [Ktedonobacterales bacterium]|jgi:threonine/homoserine/homoserine lactone efflux protein|nr:MAG: Transporter, LysE family [Ktedonobacterales bacterium]
MRDHLYLFRHTPKGERLEIRLLAFLGIAIVLTITPGPDFALVTRVGLARGRTAAWFTSLGVVTGHITWGIAAGSGVAAILNASATLFTILRLAGAVYLIWLGVHALLARDTASESHANPSTPPTTRTTPKNLVSAYRQGLFNDLLNPKIGVFYTTLLPQFIAPGQPVFLTSLLLASLFALIVAVWLGSYAVLLDRAATVFRRPKVRRILERATGLVLIGLGLRVALEQR